MLEELFTLEFVSERLKIAPITLRRFSKKIGIYGIKSNGTLLFTEDDVVNVQDVDLEVRWLVLRDTKNGTDRGVPIHRQLVKVLSGLPSATTKQGPVFLTDRGHPYKNRNREEGGQCRSAWTSACRRAGIVDLHQHDLRHTFATWGLIAGMSDRVKRKSWGTRRAR
jgi:site-specific recombinase XerD